MENVYKVSFTFEENELKRQLDFAKIRMNEQIEKVERFFNDESTDTVQEIDNLRHIITLLDSKAEDYQRLLVLMEKINDNTSRELG